MSSVSNVADETKATEHKNAVLDVHGLTVVYGVIEAVHGLNLQVRQGEVVGLLGRNGAGKSTTMKAIAGILPIKSGSIQFNGKDISKKPIHRRVKAGVCLVPEGRWIVSPLTVQENLRLSHKSDSEGEAITVDQIFELFPVLGDRQKQAAGSLSGGEQQMLAVSRALMTNPRLILLDEPAMGLSPLMTDKVLESLIKVNRLGIAILLVEQDINIARAISDRIYVIRQGEIILDGVSSDEITSQQIEDGYFE